MPTTTRLTATARSSEFTATDGALLYLALELSQRGWTLAFTTGRGQVARIRKIAAGALEALEAEIARARRRFALPATAPVVSCYEAGRDAFWVHRALLARGRGNVVVDAASIEVNRRQRRAKTDRLDARKLVAMLVRWHEGERGVWHVVHVPSEGDEDRRHLERERQTLVAEQTRLVNRLQELLATQGVEAPDKEAPAALARLAGPALEAVWGVLRRRTPPPVTRLTSWLAAQDCTIDISKARSELGYEPVKTREEGMRELKEDYGRPEVGRPNQGAGPDGPAEVT